LARLGRRGPGKARLKMANKANNFIRLTKEAIRTKILYMLQMCKDDVRFVKSGKIAQKLFRTSVFKQAKTVMFYKAIKGEVDTEQMIKAALKLGKIVVVPVCFPNRELLPCVLHQDARLVRGPYGIWEPVDKKPVNPRDVDLVVVPGVGFTKKGKRLGRGKGYYDRFLKKLPSCTPTIGLAFDFQILPDLPTSKFDVNVKKVIFA
jgi:5-formyltetrahydrofolate cyclo-ligase